jgi:hypothetical protein
VQLQNLEQNSSLNSENEWKKFGRKIHRNLGDQENQNAKKQDYWLGETITTSNIFNKISEENVEEEAKQSTEPKSPPIILSGVKISNF